MAGRLLIIVGSSLVTGAVALLARGFVPDEHCDVTYRIAPQTLHVGPVGDVVVACSLPFVNAHSFTVHDVSIVATCGCTKASGGRFDLQPGEQREIPLAFRAKSDQGLDRLVPILVSYRIGGHAVSEMVTADARGASDR